MATLRWELFYICETPLSPRQDDTLPQAANLQEGHLPIQRARNTKKKTDHHRSVVHWLGDRDSNPNYLIQSQAFYR